MADQAFRTINLSRIGSFSANRLIGRPYFLSYELVEKNKDIPSSFVSLQAIPASELYASTEDGNAESAESEGQGTRKDEGGVEYDLVGENGEVVLRTNRQTLDDGSTQSMKMDDIEKLKSQGLDGKELVAKIMDSHAALDQKTAFALAKYTLRKVKKYVKTFKVLPLDVSTLAQWLCNDKDASRILELREEALSLMCSWSNIRNTSFRPDDILHTDDGVGNEGRWLVVDEVAGLLVAYLAERLGILYGRLEDDQPSERKIPSTEDEEDGEEASETATSAPMRQPAHQRHRPLAKYNTIHMVHSANQPNLSLLKYFDFDANHMTPDHTLQTHLKTLSWLQLLHPEQDPSYAKPTEFPDEEIRSWKSNKRSIYYKKQRRWQRVKSIVDETRAGGFDGLIIASPMQPVSILRTLVPLLKGGAQIVVYSRNIEPLAELADLYSAARRTAFISNPPKSEDMPTEDFPLDPTLLLAASIQTARAKRWQVLPGRTHPLMTSRGGAEGFVFTATRVIPAEGRVLARGSMSHKKRKVNGEGKASDGMKNAMEPGPVPESRPASEPGPASELAEESKPVQEVDEVKS